jgi:hypothetical protein
VGVASVDEAEGMASGLEEAPRLISWAVDADSARKTPRGPRSAFGFRRVSQTLDRHLTGRARNGSTPTCCGMATDGGNTTLLRLDDQNSSSFFPEGFFSGMIVLTALAVLTISWCIARLPPNRRMRPIAWARQHCPPWIAMLASRLLSCFGALASADRRGSSPPSSSLQPATLVVPVDTTPRMTRQRVASEGSTDRRSEEMSSLTDARWAQLRRPLPASEVELAAIARPDTDDVTLLSDPTPSAPKPGRPTGVSGPRLVGVRVELDGAPKMEMERTIGTQIASMDAGASEAVRVAMEASAQPPKAVTASTETWGLPTGSPFRQTMMRRRDDKFRLAPMQLLSEADAAWLDGFLPRTLQGRPAWGIVYHSVVHGASIDTLAARTKDSGPIILLVRAEGTPAVTVGAFVPEKLRSQSAAFWGTGDAFVFRLSPGREHFGWKNTNRMFFSRPPPHGPLLVGGGGGGPALILNENFTRVESKPSETFGNPSSLCLAREDLPILSVEAWALLSATAKRA